MRAYYNEIDSKAAAWLRELIARGLIADGEVDERSIEDVTPNDLKGFTQCHFFAGIGGWSLALRQAGWPDDRPAWTGSCPCQPFSAAGKGKGFADERHLWPSFFHLIKVCRPASLFGEQVGGKAGRAWFDLVQDDLEGIGVACGKVEFPACSVGSPMQRIRLYWYGQDRLQRHRAVTGRDRATRRVIDISGGGGDGKLANSARPPVNRERRVGAKQRGQEWQEPRGSSLPSELGDAGSESRQRNAGGISSTQTQVNRQGLEDGRGNNRHSNASDANGPMSTNGFWRDVDWLGWRDGKWRPVEPSTFPLAHGVPARVGRLRGYGNAIVIPQAQAFIEAYLGLEG